MISLRSLLLCATVLVSAAQAADPAPAKTPYLKAGFDMLAGFPYTPPEVNPDAQPGTPPPSGEAQIPAAVKALDGRNVVVTGYMLPVKMDKGLVTEFLLVSNPAACCYGATPQINEFIVVKMTKGGVKSLMDVPVEFYGKLTVKEIFEEGYLSNIYTLEGEKMGKSAVE